MISAIIRLQECSTIPGRFAFVSNHEDAHGIARGTIRMFEVRAATWGKIRRELKEYKRGVLGFTGVRPDTVELWQNFEPTEPAQCFPGVRAVELQVELRNFRDEPIQ